VSARTTDFFEENTMYALHEQLSRERSDEWQRRSARHRLSAEFGASRRWRRRAEQARRSAESFEARAAEAARRDYELAGR
jgi:hypothetical protein